MIIMRLSQERFENKGKQLAGPRGTLSNRPQGSRKRSEGNFLIGSEVWKTIVGQSCSETTGRLAVRIGRTKERCS